MPNGLGLPTQMLNGVQDLYLQPDGVFGLGCPDCGGKCLGAVNDYDIIRVGGGNYTANQIVDKTIRANKETKLYSNTSGKGTVVGTVKAGESIGKVYSYLRADQSGDGRSWLMFESSTYNKYYYVPNEAVSSTGLKEQGSLTIDAELKAEADAKLKEESPIEYYIKKYAIKVIIAVGVIVLSKTLVVEGIKKIGSSKPTPALTGVKRKRKVNRVSKRKK